MECTPEGIFSNLSPKLEVQERKPVLLVSNNDDIFRTSLCREDKWGDACFDIDVQTCVIGLK